MHLKITKFVHSCLLVESADRVALFDPGDFSWNSGLVNLDTWPVVNRIIITHEHEDHCSEDFVRALAKKFPEALFITNEVVAKKLVSWGVEHITTRSTVCTKIFSTVKHASVLPFATEPPDNIAVHHLDVLTAGGDRHDLEESKAVLALPMTAPWGTFMEAAKMAERLKPQFVLPIHDWHWNDAARTRAYAQMTGFLAEKGMTFVPLVDGESIELDIPVA
jgi:L-ascorbate metabolism protein UlaG (beta-lactamase superfamily)